jgi:elongation factor Ts
MAPFFTFKSVRFHAGQIKSSEDFRMAEITASLVKSCVSVLAQA